LARAPAGCRGLAIFAQDQNDARVAKRIQALADRGWEVTGFTFHRPRADGNRQPQWENVELGPTHHRAYRHRFLALIKALPKVWRHRRRIAAARVLYAINFDNALLALAGRFVGRSKVSLVVEIADIQPAFMRPGVFAALLRWAERRVLRRCRCLVTTSPRYTREYFRPIQRYFGPVFLLENKVYPSNGLEAQSTGAPAPGPPWIIGYFGAFRCQRSLDIIKQVARALPDTVRFKLRGFPSSIDADRFHREIAEIGNIDFRGPYRYPDDLPELYDGVHFNWCFDFQDVNARWLLPNRIYEGGLFRVPALAARDDETGAWTARHQSGWVFDPDPTDSLIHFLRHLRPSRWIARQRACAGLPRHLFAGEADYDQLSEMLAQY
jgi:succinoglycan biosynthesis protein ExoL